MSIIIVIELSMDTGHYLVLVTQDLNSSIFKQNFKVYEIRTAPSKIETKRE